MNNATANATYAAQLSGSNNTCSEHQDNAMDCSFSPKIQAWATQEGRTNATKSASPPASMTDPVAAMQRNNCTSTHHVGLDDCSYAVPNASNSTNASVLVVPGVITKANIAQVRDVNCSQHQSNSMDCSYKVHGANQTSRNATNASVYSNTTSNSSIAQNHTSVA